MVIAREYLCAIALYLQIGNAIRRLYVGSGHPLTYQLLDSGRLMHDDFAHAFLLAAQGIEDGGTILSERVSCESEAEQQNDTRKSFHVGVYFNQRECTV